MDLRENTKVAPFRNAHDRRNALRVGTNNLHSQRLWLDILEVTDVVNKGAIGDLAGVVSWNIIQAATEEVEVHRAASADAGCAAELPMGRE